MKLSMLTDSTMSNSLRVVVALVAITACVLTPSTSHAGHHSETKLAQEHPQYDLTDVYAFRAQEPAGVQEPAEVCVVGVVGVVCV